MPGTRRQERAVLTANQYAQGDIEGLSDYSTRRLIASTVLTESNGGELGIVNSAGYVGRYQAGATWLADAGYVDADKVRAAMAGYRREWTWAESGGMTRFLEDPANWKDGLSLEQYKASADLQDQAFKRNSDAAYRTAVKQGVLQEGDSEEHIAGFLKARHISGYGGAVKVVRNQQAFTDDYGTSSYDYYNDIALNRDGLNELLVIEAQFKGVPYKLPVEKELRPGDANLAVSALQENLKLVGALDAGGRVLQVDGDYGKSTREAVSAYQQQQQLPATGTADVVTLMALKKHAEAISATPDIQQVAQQFQVPGYRNDWMKTNDQGLPAYLQTQAPVKTVAHPPRDALADGVLKAGDRGPEVARLQESLIQLGINDHVKQPIKADGVFGQDTQRAVQAFQLWHGMEQVNGIADRQTLTAVNTQVGLAIIQRSTDQATGHTSRDFVANVNLGAPILPEAAALPREANQASNAAIQPTPNPIPTASTSLAPPSGRAEPALNISQLPPEDQAMFAKIRQAAPDRISDEKVAEVMLQAKQNGIPDAGRIQRIDAVDGNLWVTSVTPGFYARVSTAEQAPSMQDTLRQTQSFNQQMEHNLTQRVHDDPSRGPKQ